MKFLLRYPSRAYLPEVSAYREYLTERGHETLLLSDTDNTDVGRYDAEWSIMGTDYPWRHRRSMHAIHDFRGIPLRPLPGAKILAKKVLSHKPQMRIFLNTAVQQAFHFTDLVPSVIVDMGVHPRCLTITRNARYDAIYVGELSPNRRADRFLEQFATGHCRRYSVLLVGTPSNALHSRFRQYSNIVFAGRVPHAEIPNMLATAHVGLNLIPPVYPFSVQTSTKFLEYLASGLQVVSTPHSPSLQLAAQLNKTIHIVRAPEELASALLAALRSSDVLAQKERQGLTWPALFERAGLLARIEGVMKRPQS